MESNPGHRGVLGKVGGGEESRDGCGGKEREE